MIGQALMLIGQGLMMIGQDLMTIGQDLVLIGQDVRAHYSQLVVAIAILAFLDCPKQ